jgi:hypothetical protein
MLLGGILAGSLTIVIYFVSKLFVATKREQVSMSLFFGGATCISTAGFLSSPELGFFAAGLQAVMIALILGYEAGE